VTAAVHGATPFDVELRNPSAGAVCCAQEREKDVSCDGPMASDQFAMACRASALLVGKLVGDLVRCLLDVLVRDVRIKGVKVGWPVLSF